MEKELPKWVKEAKELWIKGIPEACECGFAVGVQFEALAELRHKIIFLRERIQYHPRVDEWEQGQRQQMQDRVERQIDELIAQAKDMQDKCGINVADYLKDILKAKEKLKNGDLVGADTHLSLAPINITAMLGTCRKGEVQKL